MENFREKITTSNKRRTSKRDRSGDRYRYSEGIIATAPADDWDEHRESLKRFMGNLVDAVGTVDFSRKNSFSEEYCLLNNIIVSHEDDNELLEYVWIKRRKLDKANILSGSKIHFSARVKIYKGDTVRKTKYGLVLIEIKDIL